MSHRTLRERRPVNIETTGHAWKILFVARPPRRGRLSLPEERERRDRRRAASRASMVKGKRKRRERKGESTWSECANARRAVRRARASSIKDFRRSFLPVEEGDYSAFRARSRALYNNVSHMAHLVKLCGRPPALSRPRMKT